MLGLIAGKMAWSKIIKFLVVAGFLFAIMGSLYFGYRYVTNQQATIQNLQSSVSTLKANNATLDQAITEQKTTIESLRQDIELQSEVISETQNSFNQARDTVRRLEDRLSEHELGFLAKERPVLVENIINNATQDVNRCFEILSGAPLTDQEINAKLPSEFNSECPEIANPQYQENQ